MVMRLWNHHVTKVVGFGASRVQGALLLVAEHIVTNLSRLKGQKSTWKASSRKQKPYMYHLHVVALEQKHGYTFQRTYDRYTHVGHWCVKAFTSS